MLIDEIEVTFKGGDGGNGKVSFGKMAKSGPDGGNGGHGGSIFVKGSHNVSDLSEFRYKKEIEAHSKETKTTEE